MSDSISDGTDLIGDFGKSCGITSREVCRVLDVITELHRGRDKFGLYASSHEALGVILEEFEEFKDAIKDNDVVGSIEEAKQLAAVSLRFYIEFRAK